MKKVLVTGAAGQIGSELTGVLRNIYGNDHVIAAGHVKKPGRELLESGPFHVIDCTKICLLYTSDAADDYLTV